MCDDFCPRESDVYEEEELSLACAYRGGSYTADVGRL